MSSPTRRTLERLRKLGYTVDVVEKVVPMHQGDKDAKPVFIRRDLFNCIDIVAVKAGQTGVLAIQATTASNVSSRVKKATGLPELKTWLQAGNAFQVWGWEQKGKRWEPRVTEVSAADMQARLVSAKRRRREATSGNQQGELSF